MNLKENAHIQVLKMATKGMAKSFHKNGVKKIILIMTPTSSGFEDLEMKAQLENGEINDITNGIKKQINAGN